jgi:hypothetical protein
MIGAVPLLPQYAFMAWCSVKAQGQLYLFLPFNFNLNYTLHKRVNMLYVSINLNRLKIQKVVLDMLPHKY